jgi:hypothetical protein
MSKDSWTTKRTKNFSGGVTSIHILPRDEFSLGSHILSERGVCSCEPFIILTDEMKRPLPQPVIIHSSYDGREAVDEAKKILSNA